jgi:predicted nucleotidyltransferase
MAWSERTLPDLSGESEKKDLTLSYPDQQMTAPSSTRYSMNQQRNSHIDPHTESAVRLFIQRASVAYTLLGAILFGSRARHQNRPDSDADVAVLLHGRRGPFLDTKLALSDIAYDVLLETGILIQPLPVWEDEWKHPDRAENPRLIKNIAREGIRL